MGRTAAGLLLVPLLLACNPGSEPTRVDYGVRVIEGDPPRVEIAAELANLPGGDEPLRLGMNSRYAYIMPETALLEGPPELRDGEGRAIPLLETGPFDWSASIAGARSLTLRYAVPLVHRELPGVAGRDGYEQPFLAETHGMLATGALFIAPLNAGEPELSVRFELPAGWDLFCPWEEPSSGRFVPESVAALREDLIALGDWAVIETERGGCRVQIAVAPGQERIERLAAPVVAEIVEAELALFGMRPRSRYLFLFHPGGPNFFGGSPKTGSMTLQLSADPERPFRVDQLARLVAHEFHHTWVHARFVPPDALRFYNEGFTDYYAHLVSARLGLIGWEEFADDLAERLERLEKNERAADLSLVAGGGPIFFESREAGDLLYHGGLLLAALLDREIRGRHPGRSLDDFMRDFNNDPQWGWDNPPTLAGLLAAVELETDAGYVARFERWVSEPWSLDAEAAFEAVGVKVGRAPSGRGWRVAAEPWREHALEP